MTSTPHERIGGFIWAESPDGKLWMEHVINARLVLGTMHFEMADRADSCTRVIKCQLGEVEANRL